MNDIFGAIAAKMDDTGVVAISENDVFQWATQRDQTAGNFLDSFGFELATRFHRGQLSYEFCDEVVNELWVILIGWIGKPLSKPWPDTFYEVYDAFDAGEYHRKEDKTDDPVGDFTRPMITQIVRKCLKRFSGSNDNHNVSN
ncbi:hypothetical protein E3U23_06650 [Erythrobacter litoralis]|uniref:hypothetical protein n=1 Tax=Erythrobacter litoralis TaxID=39960 RepID=UPI002435DD64|nr:hypothetical protein [Erythrobacter litoralis]MDG6078870.1 hypothetical protein [Erythrobacter litoralis]